MTQTPTPKSKERLLHNLRLELGAMKVEEYGVIPTKQTLDNILDLFTSYTQHLYTRQDVKAICEEVVNLDYIATGEDIDSIIDKWGK